ncbi:hypothetical protein FA063_29260, partial [Pseudomonas aeruginosa]|nr:hypothetical protein [Pseudomonas aeruginosa]
RGHRLPVVECLGRHLLAQRRQAGGKRVKLALCGAALNGQKMELEPLARLIYRYILAGHRQRALQHHRAPGSDGSGA